MVERVEIFEVGPRDGLQNEHVFIETQEKARLIDMLAETGIAAIEATSFVSPKWVPQMADAADVMRSIRRKAGVRYAALTPNMKGYEAARESEVSEVAVFAAASEAFSQRNINCTIVESLQRFAPLMAAAAEDGIPVRGYVSCVVACPYEGDIHPQAVLRVTAALLEAGCYEVSLGDTIGVGNAAKTAAMLDTVMATVRADRLAGHFHDTHGRALECIDVCLQHGIRTFDASIGGLGGCPYAPGASGNVATEAVTAHLTAGGFETGIDPEKLEAASGFALGLKTRKQ